MVDMDMSDDQRAHVSDQKVNAMALQIAPIAGFLALEQTAIHQQRMVGVELQAVTTAGDAPRAAVMGNLHRHRRMMSSIEWSGNHLKGFYNGSHPSSQIVVAQMKQSRIQATILTPNAWRLKPLQEVGYGCNSGTKPRYSMRI